jgi:hypothetical protein
MQSSCRSWISRSLLGPACLFLVAGGLLAQANPPPHDNRILGILTNYHTVPDRYQIVKPLTSGEKLQLAAAASFSPAAMISAGLYAGFGQVENRFPTWGQGGKGFAMRYGAAYADQAIGAYLTDAVFPIILHQDPRYFRMGGDGFVRRMAYAVSRVAITRSDAGLSQVNYSEFLGAATAAGAANLYYPAESRTVGYTMQKFGVQLASGALFNVLREFLPDVRHKLSHQSEPGSPNVEQSFRIPTP